MIYQVRIIHSGEKDLDKLPPLVRSRLRYRVLSLETGPRPRGVKKLSGREEYRLRVGEYRILYTIDDKSRAVSVVAIVHRRKAYR